MKVFSEKSICSILVFLMCLFGTVAFGVFIARIVHNKNIAHSNQDNKTKIIASKEKVSLKKTIIKEQPKPPNQKCSTGVTYTDYLDIARPFPKDADFEKDMELRQKYFNDVLFRQKTLLDAVNLSKKYFSSDVDIFRWEFHGRGPLVKWMNKNKTTFRDLKHYPSPGTNYQLVMDNPESEIGKMLCGTGKVVQIEIVDYNNYIVSIVISGNTVRSLLAGKIRSYILDAELNHCGIVTGIESCEMSDGTTKKAVRTVGMLDIPDNY